jgi:HlyD family secretion protein
MDMGLFRKVSLDRLSSPEQLDQLLHVTTPKSWLALFALISVLTVTVIWGYTGSIPTKAEGQGVIVRTGTVLNVVAVGSGLVTEIDVNPGDQVRANQVVARISLPEMLEKMRLAQQAMGEAIRNRDFDLKLRQEGAGLQTDALTREKANAEREIRDLNEQSKLVADQIAVDAQLLSKGLITKQQTLATQQKLVSLAGQIETQRAKIKQIDADIFNAKAQPVQSDAQAKNAVAEMQRNLDAMHEQLEMISNVISPYAGQVVELKTVQGTLVAAGSPILSIQPQETALEVIVYLPSEKAKAVSPGMEAEVSPSIVKREEYGFIKGKVTYVADFPATPAAMMRNFENPTLVQSLVGAGPVTELRLIMDSDPNSYSGFKWSSGKGPPIKLSSGTICTALIVTHVQSPVSLLLPYVKGKLGLG